MDSATYYNYGTQKDGSFMVAGGGLVNGNAYAQVEKIDDKYYYREYGKNAFRKYIGDKIEWIGDDGDFKVFEEENKEKEKEELFESILKFRISSYPLLDINIIDDDWIVAIEEQWLYHFGYEYEEYQDWKDSDSE